jgi:methyl-accepting chemotaxis protein
MSSTDFHGTSMLNRVRISMGIKVSLAVFAILLAAGLTTTALAGRQMHSALLVEFQSKGDGISRGLATMVVAFIMRDDGAKLQGAAAEFSKTPGVAYVLINNPNGQVLGGAMHLEGAGADKDKAAVPELLVASIVTKEEMQADAKMLSNEVEVQGIGRFLDMSYPIMSGALGRAHVGLDLDAIEARTSELKRSIALTFAAFMVASVLAAVLLGQLLLRPLRHMGSVLQAVSTGDLALEAKKLSNDEFLDFGDNLNQTIAGLRRIVSSVRSVTVAVNTAAEEILATANKQERAVTEQVSGLEEISQTMSALTDTARAIADRTDSVTQVTDQMSDDVKQGQVALAASRESVMQIVEQNGIIVDRINKLFEQSEAIIAVIDIIDSISDRLDLLALNAALEGTRAGDAGKGFSLVAAEMRRLAENVSESTREIKGTIQQIHGLVRAALEASETGTQRTQTGASEMEKTVEVMSRIFELIDQTAASSQQITIITQQQLSSSQQVVTAMRDVTAIATQGVAASREVNQAAAELTSLSSRLQGQVAVFRVTTETDASMTPTP